MEPESITHGHHARIAEIRDHWLSIRLAVGPSDRERAEAGVAAAYAAAGLATPSRFVWVDSPLAGGHAADHLDQRPLTERDQVHGKLLTRRIVKAARLRDIDHGRRLREDDDSVHDALRVLNEIPPVDGFFRGGVQLGDNRSENIVGGHVPEPSWLEAVHQIWRRRGGHVDRPKYDVVNRSRIPYFIAGRDGARRLAQDAALQALGVEGPGATGLTDVAQAASWWWPFKDIAILCELPILDRRDANHQLHCDDGPAMLYPDGYSIWAWRGVKVPPALIIGTWDVGRILAEPNTEIRRCAIERMGWDRFIKEGRFLRIGQPLDDPGNPGHTLALYDVPQELQQSEPIRLLLCTNATDERDGTRRSFGLTVPAHLDHPIAAAGWTFDLTQTEYAALVRAS